MAILGVRHVALMITASLLVPACAHAADSAGTSASDTTGASPMQTKGESKDDSLTFHGITLYGVIDIGVAYQSHGVKLSGDFPPGLEYVVSKNSGKSLVSLAPNALSQSKIGLRGKEPITDDLSGVFQIETQFVPTSGRLADGLKAVADNNGRPLAAQTAFGDSSKTGQLFAGQAWVGLASKRYGTLTFGRHYSLFLDDVLAYDPMGASHAFSVIGYQGAAQAGASTEDARLDQSLKYTLHEGPVRLAGLYEFGEQDRPATRAYQVDLGFDTRWISVDLTYGHVNDSISASPLSATQMLTAPSGSIAAAVSDNNAFGAFAKLAVTPKAKIFIGYEAIEYQNPSHPLAAGDQTIGDYVLGVVNNTAYAHHRHLDYVWAGARYAVSPKIEFTLAYYQASQNSFAAVGCATSASSQCSGRLQAVSAMALFKIVKRLDLYTGAMYSRVSDGMASGYLNRSSIDPMAGVRFTF